MKYNYWIEIPGFLGLISMFFAVWIDGYFLRFLGTSILFWAIAVANTKSLEKKNEKKTE